MIDIKTVKKGKKAVKEAIKKLKNKKTEIMVFDCASGNDLSNIAEALDDCRLICGAAPLARKLIKNSAKSRICIKIPRPKSSPDVIGVVGSIKKITSDQLKKLKGVKIINIDPQLLLKNKKVTGISAEKDIMIRIDTSKKALQVLRLFIKKHGIDAAGNKIGSKLGKICIKIMKKKKADKLIFSGGTTAFGVCRQLGVKYLLIAKKILAGVPLTYSPEKRLFIVTKPGGFGRKNAFKMIINTLKGFKGVV